MLGLGYLESGTLEPSNQPNIEPSDELQATAMVRNSK